ncbi:MAG: hypothetical protein ABIK28_03660 [Planctomycetota bacterium]
MKRVIKANQRTTLHMVMAAFAFLCLIGNAAATTWIVDDNGGPGIDFTDIGSAVSAATPGDLIVVRNGMYASFNLDKGLTITADTGHAPVVISTTNVYHIPVDATAVLTGLSLHQLFVFDSWGNVIIDDCDCIHWGNIPSLKAEQCSLLRVSRCRFEKTGLGSLLCAAILRDTAAIISESSFVGGNGQDSYDDYGFDGGCGIFAQDATLYLQAVSAQGGNGGWAYGEEYANGGDGGEGLWLSKCDVHLFGMEENRIEGGQGGGSYYGTSGRDASAVLCRDASVAYSGIFLESHGEPDFDIDPDHPSMVAHVSPDVPIVTLGGTGQLGGFIEPVLHGQAGSSFALFYSHKNAMHPLGSRYTDLLLDPLYLFFFAAGVIPAGDPPGYPIHIPLVPDYMGFPFQLQAHVVTGGGQYYLSTSAGFVLR